MSVSSREAAVAQPVTYRRPRRRQGLWLPLFAILLVVVGIVVVADRVAAKAASNELKSRIEAELVSRDVTYSSLDVVVGGTPFLTQVAEGRYDSITIDMTAVHLPAGNDRAATLPELHVVASGVNAAATELIEGTASVVAENVRGTAVISYDTLSGLLDLSAYRLSEITFNEEDGAIKASASANIAGLTLPIQALADVSVVNRKIQVQLRDARAVGVPVPDVAKGFLDDLVAHTLVAKLPPLPFGLTLDRLTVNTEGLGVTATGSDVPLVNGRSGG
jgi:LmeA-like phospholipid-binding